MWRKGRRAAPYHCNVTESYFAVPTYAWNVGNNNQEGWVLTVFPMKLLLAVDGTIHSVPPVRAVATRPWPSCTQVRVLHVVDRQNPMVSLATESLVTVPPSSGAPQVFHEDAELLLEDIADTVRHAGLPTDMSIGYGDPGRGIIEEARDWGADLIVMGSRGWTGLKRVIMGSAAQYVVAHAHCSVEVVRSSISNAVEPFLAEARQGA